MLYVKYILHFFANFFYNCCFEDGFSVTPLVINSYAKSVSNVFFINLELLTKRE